MGCKSATTPLPTGLSLFASDGPLFDPEKYRRLVGQLLYLNLTRPDLSYVVQQLSQFMSAPTSIHWDVALHVMRYLKGCPSLGLFYPSQNSFQLLAYSDVDYGNCPDSRKSLIGFCIFLGNSLVSWRCKKQNTCVYIHS